MRLNMLLIFSLVVLTGCGPNLQSSEIKTDKTSLDSKAIVITRIHAPFKTIFGGKSDSKVDSIWQKIDQSKSEDNKILYNLGREGLFSDWNTNAIHDHMVEPGTYFLKKMTYERGNYHHTITLPQAEMLFKAKPGEVIYIGDIKVIESEGRASVEIEDHYDDAVKYFKESRPEINKPVQKRLVIGISHVLIDKFKDYLKKGNSDQSKKVYNK